MTYEADVVAAKTHLAILKSDYMDAIDAYLSSTPPTSPQAKTAALEIQKKGTAYFNHAEEFVGNSDLLGAHRSDLWAQGFAEDCAEILSSMPAHYKFLVNSFQHFQDLRDLSVFPGQTAFANMQRMVVAYLSRKLTKELRQSLIQAGIPVYGFDNQATPNSSMKFKKILAFAFGISTIIVVLAFAFIFSEPTRFQRAVLWAILSMALAGVASVIPGFIEVNLRSFGILAGGRLLCL